MPNTSTSKSARQVFGEALRFYREQRDYNQARVADIAKVSRSDVEDWEAGRTVPDSKAWELLKKMMHKGLVTLAGARQQALAEVDAERALVQRSMQRGQAQAPKPAPTQQGSKPLTTRPFAEALAKVPILTIVPEPAPEPKSAPVVAPVPPAPTSSPITTPEGVPATLLGEDFDLTDAYTTVNALPDGWGTAEAREARYHYARKLYVEGVDPEDIVTRTREKFTVGISRATLKKVRTEVDRLNARIERSRKAERDATKTTTSAVDVEVSAPPPPAPVPPPDDTALIAHAKMILAKSPSIKIDDLVGQLQASFKRSLPSQQLYILRTEARAAWTKKTEALRGNSPMPTPPAPVTAPATAPNSDIEAAAQIVLSAIPNLRTFTITVDDSGEVTVSHTVREVRVIEASGSIKLKR